MWSKCSRWCLTWDWRGNGVCSVLQSAATWQLIPHICFCLQVTQLETLRREEMRREGTWQHHFLLLSFLLVVLLFFSCGKVKNLRRRIQILLLLLLKLNYKHYHHHHQTTVSKYVEFSCWALILQCFSSMSCYLIVVEGFVCLLVLGHTDESQTFVLFSGVPLKNKTNMEHEVWNHLVKLNKFSTNQILEDKLHELMDFGVFGTKSIIIIIIIIIII